MGGIDVINLETRKITHFKHEPGKPGSLSDNRVWDFCLDRNNEIWVATSKGVDKYNRQTNSFEHYPQLTERIRFRGLNPIPKGICGLEALDEVIVFESG
jgi:ligand-binding sensor domain-containing protein